MFLLAEFVLMIFDQLFVRRDEPLEEIGQALEVMRASLMLVRLYNRVVLMYQILSYYFLNFEEHLRILFTVPLVQTSELAIRDEALAVRK